MSKSQSTADAVAAAGKCHLYSHLSVPRQALVRLCQSMNYGSIEGLCVKDAEPVFDPPPCVLVDVRLDGDEVPRLEADLTDFQLCNEVHRLMRQLQELTTGVIERIDVRAGIPRRIVFRGSFTKIRPELDHAPDSNLRNLEH